MANETLNIAEEPASEGVEQQVAVVEQAPLRVPTTLKSLIEALVFAAKEPLTIKQLQALYESQGNDGEERRIEPAEVSQIIEALNGEFAAAEKPYRIIPLAGGFQFATQPVYAEWLGKLYKEQARRRLSQSSIESLSIIAYKQPISKSEIELIRGVNCDYVLKTLLEKELVTIVGRAPTPGRPLLYGTTREFLKHFGLNDVSDLPRPREIEEILGESQFEAERRMLEAQQGLAEDQKKEEEDFKSRLPHIPKRKPSLDETVRIISRKKTRELKIRTEDEAQEPIPFNQATSTEAPPTDSGPSGLNEAVPEADDADVGGTNRESPAPIVLEQSSQDRAGEAQDDIPTETIQHPTEDSVVPSSIEPSFAEIGNPVDAGSTEVVDEDALEAAIKEQESIVEAPSAQQAMEEQEGDSGRSDELTTADLVVPESTMDEVQSPEDDTLHVQSPSFAMPHEDLPEPPSVAQAETPAGRQQAPHSKTPWQTWKEKIQGFIKKLFG
jgi:segregation and condensation protein B